MHAKRTQSRDIAQNNIHFKPYFPKKSNFILVTGLHMLFDRVVPNLNHSDDTNIPKCTFRRCSFSIRNV